MFAYPEQNDKHSSLKKEEIIQKLKEYFTDGITSRTLQTVGAEIETQFLDNGGDPISTNMSQQILNLLISRGFREDLKSSAPIKSEDREVVLNLVGEFSISARFAQNKRWPPYCSKFSFAVLKTDSFHKRH